MSKSIDRKLLANGKPNPNYVDLLEEDPPIAGQKYGCFSFLSPEKILKQKDMYLFEKFLQQFDFTYSFTKFNDFLSFISYKYHLNLESLQNDFKEFVEEEGDRCRKESAAVETMYRNFLDENEEKWLRKFQKEHDFATSTRGLKFRGVFNTQEEAERHCAKLREIDPHHDILVGQTGVWMPWDPDAYKTGRVEFLEEELNQLHKEKVKNEEKAREQFELRVREAKRKAIKENLEKAQKSGNVLTQTIDENDQLCGVSKTIDFENREVATEEGLEENKQSVFTNAGLSL
jgi:hypothetical protein